MVLRCIKEGIKEFTNPCLMGVIMRYSGDWMSLADDRILEYIRENDSGSPTEMKREGKIRYSANHIGRRCQKLAKKGLLRHLGNGVYVITEDGEHYLDGKLDTETWTYLEKENNGEGSSGSVSNST